MGQILFFSVQAVIFSVFRGNRKANPIGFPS